MFVRRKLLLFSNIPWPESEERSYVHKAFITVFEKKIFRKSLCCMKTQKAVVRNRDSVEAGSFLRSQLKLDNVAL